MAEIVRMPKLSDTMTEGVVADWLVNVGDTVSSGDILAEIETDKATMEFESFYDGVLLHIGVQKGEKAPVNDVLAIIGEKGEDVQKILAEAGNGAEAAPAKEEPKAEAPKAEAPKAAAPAEAPKPEPAPAPAPAAAPAPAPVVSSTGGRVVASPLAKKMAVEKGIDLSTVRGSGDNGRIIKRDIENFAPGAAAPAAASFSSAPAGVESFREEPVSQMRAVIARRLAESKFQAPHFYLTIDIDMDEAIASREKLKAMEVKVSFNDYVIKAVAKALKKHPAINSAWLGDKIRYNDHVHIGVAVAVPDGLLVPVVRHADVKGMAQISAEVREYAQKAKDKKLQPSDWEGNTFTISNLGMFGIDEFTAIINPPDSCIMAVGGIRQEPVVKNGQIVPGNRMKVTLSCDHRVVDGASGAEFLQTFKSYMENPVMMLV